MAGDAAIAEDPGDLLGVGDGRVPLGLRDPADPAAGGLGPRRGDRPAGQQVVERRGQVAPGRRRAVHAEAELVVDPAAIAHDPARVEDEDLRRPLDAQPVGQLVAHVLQQRERQVCFAANRDSAEGASCGLESTPKNATPFFS